MKRKSFVRVALACACAGLLLGGTYFLAPTQLGGRTTYVTTVGTSMEPLLHAGDLVVVRADAPYSVGDVVAYQSPELDTVVLHRIVARDGDHFVFKGDNNTWLDSYHPTADQLLGRMVVRLPGFGRHLGAVDTPMGMATIASLGAVGVIGGRKRARRKGVDHDAVRVERSDPRRSNASGGKPPRHTRSGSGSGVLVLGVVAVLALVVTVLLFVLSPTVVIKREAVYSQQGSFSYKALAPKGDDVYGRPTARTGDPVYLRLADRMTITFNYTLDSPAAAEAVGTIRMMAEVSDINGWRRAIPLAPRSSFEGTTATVSGTLDLSLLSSMTTQLEQATGVQRGQYTVTVTPHVQLQGALAGQELATSFAPPLAFLLDPYEIQLLPTGAAAPGEVSADPLSPAVGDSVQVRSVAPRTFSVGGTSIGLSPARTGALALESCALFGLLVLALGRFRAARRGEPALIEARLGKCLIPVRTDSLPSLNRVVEVGSFDSLVRLAEHYGHVVLHEERDDLHAYFVEQSGVTYRYASRMNESRRRR
ncbi:MAG: signal peptidase I [Actinomycetota bacterium]